MHMEKETIVNGLLHFGHMNFDHGCAEANTTTISKEGEIVHTDV